MSENIKMKGRIMAVLFDENDNIKQTLSSDNLIVTVGKEWLVDRIGSNTPSTASLVGIGTGATSANVANTALESQTAAVNGTVSQPAALTHSVVATFGAGVGTGTITEYGLYASGSALVGRIVTGTIVKGAADSLQVTYQLTVP